ncbi:MAG TPA: TIGR03118 family protein [Phycisphaerales bacterium]|nr:TIGR03118 family protein [Phycisphaerales bacterium]
MNARLPTALAVLIAAAATTRAQVYKTPDPRDATPTPFVQPDAGERKDHRNSYVMVKLVSTRAADRALLTDPLIKDAWGLALRPPGKGGHWWTANTATGTTTTYVGDAPGHPFGQDALKAVPIPVGKLHEKNETISQPTGQVYTGWNKDEFVIEGKGDKGQSIRDYARFVFVCLDGTVSAWANDMAASVNVIDKGAQGAMYTGVAVTESFKGGNRLYCCDFNNRRVDVFDGAWRPVKTEGEFKAPGVDDDYAVYNLLHHQGKLYAALARSANEPGDAEAYPGYGVIAEFDLEGRHVRTLARSPHLNAPWGLCVAPKEFGPFSGSLLVANFGDGRVVGYDLATGGLIDHLRDAEGKPFEIDGVWDMKFGNGETLGYANHLYFTAGPEQETEGLFGKLVPLFP